MVEVVADSAAPPDAVWRWLADASSWSTWTALTTSHLEREGVPAPDGVGALRRLGRLGGSSREEVVVFDPPRHLAYRLVRGLPVADYRADVTLAPSGSGTHIVWHGEFDARYPGTGRPMAAFLRRVLGDFATRLASHAERELT